MEILKKANWLRGFLDSLSYSDSISKKQIEVLKNKIEELIGMIEDDNDAEVNSFDIDEKGPKRVKKRKLKKNEPIFSQPVENPFKLEENELPF